MTVSDTLSASRRALCCGRLPQHLDRQATHPSQVEVANAFNRAWPFYLLSQLKQKKGRAQLRAQPLVMPWLAGAGILAKTSDLIVTAAHCLPLFPRPAPSLRF